MKLLTVHCHTASKNHTKWDSLLATLKSIAIISWIVTAFIVSHYRHCEKIIGWILCHFFVIHSTMGNWIFITNAMCAAISPSLAGKYGGQRGEKGRDRMEGELHCAGLVWNNTWRSFKRDAMILAGYHLIGCDSKALWEFRGEQGFWRSEKERKLGGGLVKG